MMFDDLSSCVYIDIFHALWWVHAWDLGLFFYFQFSDKHFYKGCCLHMTIPRLLFVFPVSSWSVYAFFLHLPVTVQRGMKKRRSLFDWGLLAWAKGASLLCPPSLQSLPLCFHTLWGRAVYDGSLPPPPTPSPKLLPSPRSLCGSGSVPALVIDPFGPLRHIQRRVEQNHC